MRQILVILLLVLSLISVSQTVPQKINYQGVVRSANGNPMVSTTIGVKLQILKTSSNNSVVSTESRTVATNALGLFNTQIGNSPTFAGIEWNKGLYALEVGIDTLGGSNYVTMGSQQLVSVPYALAAGSAPSPALSFSNNVLTVGDNSILIPPSAVNTPSTSIVATGASTAALNGSTYTIHTASVTVNPFILTPNTVTGLAQISGTYPNYSVVVAPVISYSPTVGTLSLSSPPVPGPGYNYTYNITPQLSLSGNTLTVGPPSNSVTLLTAGSTPITSLAIGAGGVGSISNPVTNSFSITIPQSSITTSGSGLATVTSPGTNSFNIAVPAVSITANPSLGLADVSGSFPNYTITVAPTFSYSNSTGSVVVTNQLNPALSYSFNTTPSLSLSSGVLTSGPASNSVLIPTSAPPVILGTGAATVSSLANNFTVSVPSPSIVSAGGATVQGTYPSFTVNAPPQLNLSTINGASLTGTYPNYTVNAPQQLNLATIGGASLTGAYPNYTVNAPQQLTLSSVGGASLTGAYPSYTLNAPQQLSITTIAGASLTGAYPSYTLSAPQQLTLSTVGGASLTGSYPSFTVDAPAQVNIIAAGGTTLSGTYPNITVNTPQKVSINPIAGTFNGGLLSITGTYPNYSLAAAPIVNYSQTTGSLTLTNPTTFNSFSYPITPNLTATNNVIQAGPAFNTVAIVSPAAQDFAVNSIALTVFPTPGQIMSAAFTKQSASSEIDLFAHFQANSGIFALAGEISFELRVDGVASAVSVPHYLSGSSTIDYVTLKAVFAGLAAGPHTVSVWGKVNVGTSVGVQLDPGNRGGKIILKETY